MAETTTTPLMLLIVPVPGQRLGPEWSEDLVTIFDRLDSHDHTDDSGARITPGAIDMTADLSFTDSDGNARKAKQIRGVQFTSLDAALAGITEYSQLHQVGAELYFLDGNGNAVQLTSNGAVAGAAGSITGMADGAAVTYSTLAKVYVFTQSAAFPADLDAGSVTVREKVDGGKGVTIKAATGLLADFDFIFPAALPAAGKTQLVTVNDVGQAGFAAAPVLNTRPTFEGMNPGDTTDVTAGNVRYHAGDLEGRVAGAWVALTGANGNGVAGQHVGRASHAVTARTQPATNIPFDGTVPQSAEGTAIDSVAYTPKKIGNRLRVTIDLNYGGTLLAGDVARACVALFKDAAASASKSWVISAFKDAASTVANQNVRLVYEEDVTATVAQTWAYRLGQENFAAQKIAVNDLLASGTAPQTDSECRITVEEIAV